MRSFRVLQGDVLDNLRELPDESVHCCVTSPPYWGLRQYGTEPQIWGGDVGCEHEWTDTSYRDSRKTDATAGSKQRSNTGATGWRDALRQNQTCANCGAWSGELGLEPTPDAFVEHIVAVFREVRRVLRSDGSLWLNLGDSYSGGKTGRSDHGSGDPKSRLGPNHDGLPGGTVMGPIAQRPVPSGFKPKDKPKDLVGIPWRVAFALQADGWWLRSDIIWHKPNPMPESVTDRPTKSHEYLFLLAKSERYYYDAEAIAEPAAVSDPSNPSYRSNGKSTLRARLLIPGQQPHSFYTAEAPRFETTRNKRSVWTVSAEPFPEAHFATFPTALVEPCILAGSPEGGTVLDPFNGSGTTGLVALRLNREYIGIELNKAYVEMARRRIYGDAPLLNCEATA